MTEIKKHLNPPAPSIGYHIEQAVREIKERVRKETIEEIIKEIAKRKNNLTSSNYGGGVCNPRCHDSGRESEIDDVITLLRDLAGINIIKKG
jgi:hypothetical protein